MFPMHRYWKDSAGFLRITSCIPGTRVYGVPADWVEVDAAGNPLEPIDEVQSHDIMLSSPCCKFPYSMSATSATRRCQKCGVNYSDEALRLMHAAGVKLPAVKKPSDRDPREEELYRRWTSGAGEKVNEKYCGNDYKRAHPTLVEPCDIENLAHQEAVFVKLKRQLSAMLHSYPVCHQTRQTVGLRLQFEQHPDKGQVAYLAFKCDCK